MKQLALQLSARAEPRFGNFVAGANAELVAALHAVARGSHSERFVYLWGAPGSGRSHLLAALVAESAAASRPAVLVRAPSPHAEIERVAAGSLLAIDDVDRLDAGGQRCLFGVYNRMRADSGCLVASGPRAPTGLAVRPDLATRLAWGLVYEVRGLSDEDKAVAMCARARTHGFELPQDVRDYLLRHCPRDLPFLLELVDLLDRYSLETQRGVTVPLAREVLKLALTHAETC